VRDVVGREAAVVAEEPAAEPVGGGIEPFVTRTVANVLPLRLPERLTSENPVSSSLPFPRS
jgi:hypothetical protein